MILKKTKSLAEVKVGDQLAELSIPITVTLINGGAIATRDYFPGHHDKEAAQALGSPHIFMNILTTNGLVQRFVEEWAGPLATFKSQKIKLGAPNYPGDTMTFTGEVTERDEATRSVLLSFKGKNSMGNHVAGTVTVVLP
ncbi:MAG: MaoC family dehydratase [Pseudomonas sp.]|jgi:acyl dehydratase|nr:MaoC family dehydratase [Pseudomonas sp.]MDD2221984.1 MaoC family dehydratase [Pseudomonas sp.]MDY0414777.1 MaoC family dehydratase [Pseudomonas sp.]NLO55157.1 MaoC family dehydratase [Gammaproteobacteria bacterium]